MIKRIFLMALALCMILVPVVNVDASENNGINTEEINNAQKTDVDDKLRHDINSTSHKTFKSVDTTESVALADEVPTSGTCGANATWRLEDGTLIISGTGEISGSPWSSCREKIKYINIENRITSIGGHAFKYCARLISITIPNSVTSIGEGAFGYCSSLTNITIPNSVTSIKRTAFFNCSSLTNVTIPNSVTSIGDYAFGYCSSLTNITIPDSVTYIEHDAFYNCSSLINITIPNSITSIEKSTFDECESLTHIIIPNSVTSIGNHAFSNCSSLTNVTIPNSVTSIGNHAFSNCSSLTHIIIPNSVISIRSHAFSACSSLTNITIPNSITSIEEGAFSACKSLTSISIPDGVTSIGREAFLECSNLTSIVIPNSITSIGGAAFYKCSNLTDVYYAGDKTSWQKINIYSSNDDLTIATIHFNSTVPDYDPFRYKVYTSEDTSPPNGYEGFDCSLEVCMKKTDATVYNPQLAHMLIAMCNSVHDKTNMEKTFASFKFNTCITDYRVDNNEGDITLAYGIGLKQLSNGKTLVLIVARGTKDSSETLGNLDAGANNIGEHRDFSRIANTLYGKLMNFLKDEGKKLNPQLDIKQFSNIQFVITGHAPAPRRRLYSTDPKKRRHCPQSQSR